MNSSLHGRWVKRVGRGMLDDCYSILDLRDRARRRIPAPMFHLLDGAAETEVTARRNTAAFDAEVLIPRCVVDVGSIHTSIRVLGQNIEWPLFCSPTGVSRLFHPEGELAIARAVAAAGTLYGLSMGSSYSLERIAGASDGAKMFQLCLFKNRDITWDLIRRCRESGYVALCLTVDVATVGKRERDFRSGFNRLPKQSWRSFMSFAQHPAWVLGQLCKGKFRAANFTDEAGNDRYGVPASNIIQEVDPAITWRDVRELAERWQGPLAIKGVMSADDARHAADAGVTAVIVSNHGGRQLDGAAAPIEVLPDIVRAVGDRVEVILDGGIRRGVHVLKALALGAKASTIGRPYLYGLGAGGEAGVTKALDILRTELVRAVRLAGCPDLASIDEGLLRRFSR
jgi:L-lactate dehydrogenase (cytochrome)